MAAVKLLIPLKDQRHSYELRSVLAKLGVEIVSASEVAAGALALTDGGSMALAGHPLFMPAESLDIVLTRERLVETGLPVIPTTVIERPENAPVGALVKSRDSARGGFVYQPHLGFPQEDLDISFAVNAGGDVHLFDARRLTHAEAKKSLGSRQAAAQEVAAVEGPLRAAVHRLGIRGGIHNVQFLQYRGQWCVIDWNPRPARGFTDGLCQALEAPLAFMLGIPCNAPSYLMENRSYWDSPIPLHLEPTIRALGLLPRRVAGVHGFPRISGAATSQEDLNHKFSKLESLL